MFRTSNRSVGHGLLATILAAVGISTSDANAIVFYKGHVMTTLDACDYYNEFEQGNIDADLDDGSFSGVPDGGVTIEDLLFAIDSMDLQSSNDSCTGALGITGFGRFNYTTCYPWGIGRIGTMPTTGTGGQNNIGGVRCNGATVNSSITNDLWYMWTSPVTGLVLVNTVTLVGSILTTDDTSIAVYGHEVPTLLVPLCPANRFPCPSSGGLGTKTIGYNEDSGGPANAQARVAFRAIAGNKYLIQIGGTSPCPAFLNHAECRFFEIRDLSTNPVSYADPTLRVTCDPPFVWGGSISALPLSGAACVAGLPCGNAATRMCRDLVGIAPVQPPPGTHVVIEMRYTGIPFFHRCGLRFGHQAALMPWVNARCANNINTRIITAVLDSFSPISLVQEGCPSDIDGDGGVGIEDLLAYLEIFDQGLEDADFNLDEGVTFEDLLEFLQQFDSGC